MGSDKIFEKYKLSDEEVNEAISNGILSPNIYSLLTYKKGEYYYEKISEMSHFGDLNNYFKLYDIKAYYFKYRGTFNYVDEIYYNTPSFYITDFYLIVCDSLSWVKKVNNERLYDKAISTYVIPLEKLKYIKLEQGDDFHYSAKPEYKEVQKNSALGAAVGGMVAGVPGAIAGAAINSGTKKKMTNPGMIIDKKTYTLKVKLVGEDECVYKSYYSCDVNIPIPESFYSEEKVNLINTLIENSKKKLSLEEKKIIYNNTVNEAIKSSNSTKSSNAILTVLFILFILIMCYACSK